MAVEIQFYNVCRSCKRLAGLLHDRVHSHGAHGTRPLRTASSTESCLFPHSTVSSREGQTGSRMMRLSSVPMAVIWCCPEAAVPSRPRGPWFIRMKLIKSESGISPRASRRHSRSQPRRSRRRTACRHRQLPQHIRPWSLCACHVAVGNDLRSVEVA